MTARLSGARTDKDQMATELHGVFALEDGTIHHGPGFGAQTTACGEAVFNTSMTGYQ
jgi:hypothetical protein